MLMRVLIHIGCEPGAIGAMCGGASPSDPLFWVIHPIMEKGLHIIELAPDFRDSYNFDWVNGTCDGSRIYDTVPFTGETCTTLCGGATFSAHMQIRVVCYLDSTLQYHQLRWLRQ